MNRMLLILGHAVLLFTLGCDVPPDEVQAGQCVDPVLQLYKKAPRNTQMVCPVEVEFTGSGCVVCTHVDVCGVELQLGGCSPAEGVWCVGVSHACPTGYEIEGDGMVTVGAL